MPSSQAPETIPLTGADCMLRAFDREVARWHGASHASQLVLRLGPGLDAGRLRELIRQTAQSAPIVRASIRRPAFAAPVYDLTRLGPLPPLRLHDLGPPPPEPPPLLAEAMNERFDGRRGEVLRFDLARYDDGSSDLALTWLHMLLDGNGSERLVRAMAECAAGCAGAVAPDAGEVAPSELSFRQRGERARQWQAFLSGFAERPPRSPAGPLRRWPQRLCYRVATLSAGETARIEARAREKAGFLTPVIYYMAAVIRAHHRLFEARGAVPPSYVLPLPVNVRPKGQGGAIFRTHVSMVWFQVSRETADDFDLVLEDLKVQRREAVRRGLVEAGACAIEFARYVPASLFARMVRRTLGGEICSFFFAYTGEFLAGAEDFLGAEVRNGFHAPAVPPSPGSCAALSIHRGRLNLTHVYQAGALAPGEVESFADHLRRELLGSPE